MSKMTRQAAEARLAEMKADTRWVEKYLAGDAAATREMRAVSEAIAGSSGAPAGFNPNAGVDLKFGLSATQREAMAAELIRHGADRARVDAALAADNVTP